MNDFLITKLVSMVGGIFGGGAILTFIKPKNLSDAFLRGGLSVGASSVFASPMLNWVKLDNNWENQIMAGFIVGFLAHSIMGMVANFLIKNQNKDIVEAIKEIKK